DHGSSRAGGSSGSRDQSGYRYRSNDSRDAMRYRVDSGSRDDSRWRSGGTRPSSPVIDPRGGLRSDWRSTNRGGYGGGYRPSYGGGTRYRYGGGYGYYPRATYVYYSPRRYYTPYFRRPRF